MDMLQLIIFPATNAVRHVRAEIPEKESTYTHHFSEKGLKYTDVAVPVSQFEGVRSLTRVTSVTECVGCDKAVISFTDCFKCENYYHHSVYKVCYLSCSLS